MSEIDPGWLSGTVRGKSARVTGVLLAPAGSETVGIEAIRAAVGIMPRDPEMRKKELLLKGWCPTGRG